MNLNKKWKERRNDANTENVLLTVSDIIRFFERGRININPEYQRSYRWSNEQKTKFIESLLLKYPIPPIITIKSETDNGLPNFEIIDGVQRLSTIFEFVGVKGKIKNLTESLNKLEGAEEFVEINGKNWEDFKKEEFDFVFESSSLLFMNLITKKEKIKFEMFERLNTLSTKLEPQEVRNSILSMKNKKIFENIRVEIRDISKNIFGEPDLSKRLDMEYFLEFSLIKRYEEYSKKIDSIEVSTRNKDKHFESFLGSYSKLVKIEELEEDCQEYKNFLILNENLNFKKYDAKKKKTSGAIVKYFFEILGFMYFKNKEMINEEFYIKNFSQKYTEILPTNPNAKKRFELAKKMVDEY